MTKVMRYPYFRINLFISLPFHDGRQVVLAVEDGSAGHIGAEHQLEAACWRGQPVGLCPAGAVLLDINVD